MIFLALKTEDGKMTGKISFYCRMLGVSRQGFYQYLANKDRPWKYQNLADAMKEIASEDECNDTYGRLRMYQALCLKQPEGGINSQRENRIPDYGADWPEPSTKTKTERNYKGRPGGYEIGGFAEAGFSFRYPIEKMYYRYHGDPGIQWETVCICDFRLL